MIASFDCFLRARTAIGFSIRAHDRLGPTEIAQKLASKLRLPVTARARIDAPEALIGSSGDDNGDGPRRALHYADGLDRVFDRPLDRTGN